MLAAAAGVSYNSFRDEYLAGYGLAKLDDAACLSPPVTTSSSSSSSILSSLTGIR